MHNKKILAIPLILITFLPIELQAQVVNKVVAVVNEEIVTRQDVDQLLSVLYAQEVQAHDREGLLQKMEELKKDILKRIIEDKLILSRAKELGVKVTEIETDDKLEQVKSGFPSEEAFYDMLETQGITVANLKDRYRDQIMMKKLVDFEIRSKVSILPSDIAEYYQKYREEFKQEEKRRVRHVLIKAKDEVELELARVEIARVYEALKEGASFAELAKEYSQGPHRAEGGDMGYVSHGEMLGELDEAILALKPGEFSEPVKSNIGYHIFKVTEIRDLGYFGLEEVQPAIKKMLYHKEFKKKLKGWVDDLKKEAYIDIK